MLESLERPTLDICDQYDDFVESNGEDEDGVFNGEVDAVHGGSGGKIVDGSDGHSTHGNRVEEGKEREFGENGEIDDHERVDSPVMKQGCWGRFFRKK